VENESAYVLITRLGHEVGGMLAALDIDILGRETAKNNVLIKQLLTDARLDIRDYETADSAADMRSNAQVACKRLEKLRVALLLASEHGIFSAIDIARLSTTIDVIVEDLR
jgi:hypothetical protein